jgi:hypothetical protein
VVFEEGLPPSQGVGGFITCAAHKKEEGVGINGILLSAPPPTPRAARCDCAFYTLAYAWVRSAPIAVRCLKPMPRIMHDRRRETILY